MLETIVSHLNWRDFNCSWFSLIYPSPRIHKSANDGRWHHICVSWRSSNGVWQFYKDGSLHIYTRNLHKGYTIRAGGSLMLAQEQDSLGRSFDSHQSFQGSLTNVYVWSYVLPASIIKSMSRSCLSGVGNVYKWSDFIHGVKGKTAVVIPSPCYPLSYRWWSPHELTLVQKMAVKWNYSKL